jgi:hypothetical protein
MVRLVCLANSWKREERCIAGIDLATGRWVRPVSDLPDGQIPRGVRLIGGVEPALLDVLEIPLADDGPDFGFECENRAILPGPWRRLGHLRPEAVAKYCDAAGPILHTATRFVTVPFMQALAPAGRRTLQLVEAVAFEARQASRGDRRWKGTLTTPAGEHLTASITDPIFVHYLGAGCAPPAHCLVTISLSMPWRPHEWERDEDPCWKLIAGVIALEAAGAPAWHRRTPPRRARDAAGTRPRARALTEAELKRVPF